MLPLAGLLPGRSLAAGATGPVPVEGVGDDEPLVNELSPPVCSEPPPLGLPMPLVPPDTEAAVPDAEEIVPPEEVPTWFDPLPAEVTPPVEDPGSPVVLSAVLLTVVQEAIRSTATAPAAADAPTGLARPCPRLLVMPRHCMSPPRRSMARRNHISTQC